MRDAVLNRVIRMLASRAGLSVSGAMRGRLSRCLVESAEALDITTEAYAAHLDVDPPALQSLIDEVTVQESSFFREPGQFDALTHHVLPLLSPPIRIWSSGCARGQEPYSLAMLLLENGYTDASVIATDISVEALESAKAGSFTQSGLRGLSPERRAAWMIEEDKGWTVSDKVRRMVSFARHNIATDPPPFPPGDCQVVFCRNVLIYFEPAALIAALDRTRTWLPEGGLLFLGHSESLWQVTDIFDLVQLGDAFVYRKPGVTRKAADRTGARREPVAPPVRRSTGDTASVGLAGMAPPEVNSLLEDGELAMAAGDPDLAATAFRKAVYLDTAHPVAHFQLGLALEAQHKTGAAARAFRAARTALRDLDPAHAPPELLGYRVEALVRLIEAKLSDGAQ